MSDIEDYRRAMRAVADELVYRERERSEALLAAIAALMQNQQRIEALVAMIAQGMGLRIDNINGVGR